LTLEIGGIRIRLACTGRGFFRWLDSYPAYGNFAVGDDGPADCTVHLRFRGRRQRGTWRRRQVETGLTRRHDHLRILHHDFLARATPDFSEMDAILPEADIYALDNLLRFLLSVLAPPRGGFLLHAATLEHRGEAWVFYGTSGAGKSTAAARSRPERRCLAEDATLIRLEHDGRVIAWATPLLHHPGEPPRPGGFPVRGCFRLAKTPVFTLTRLGGAEAVISLMPCVLLYQGFHLAPAIFEACHALSHAALHYEMGFSLHDDFWPPLLAALHARDERTDR
jgi:hypothetical protein